jgi:hypothetical protein
MSSNKFAVLSEINDKRKTLVIGTKPKVKAAKAPKGQENVKEALKRAKQQQAAEQATKVTQEQAVQPATVEAPAANGAEAPKPETDATAAAAVPPKEEKPEPVTKTMSEYQKELAAKRFTPTNKAVRQHVDPTAFKHLTVLGQQQEKKKEKPATPAPKPAAKTAPSKNAPQPAPKSSPKEKKEKVLSLGDFHVAVGPVRGGRGRGRGGRFNDSHEASAPNVDDNAQFPTL